MGNGSDTCGSLPKPTFIRHLNGQGTADDWRNRVPLLAVLLLTPAGFAEITMQRPSAHHDGSSLLRDEDLDPVSQEVCVELIDEITLGLCFEVHRAVKLGIFFLDEPKEDEKKYEIVDEVGLDVFGQVPLKKQFDCVCPNCQRNLAASRFAPHLEKCMGMGRNSSRIASKRIANSGKAESDVDDYDNDSDWNYNTDRKAAKKKKDKSSPRRVKSKPKNGESTSSGNGNSESGRAFANYEALSLEDRKALLMQMCGVISEHTKKMCTRSHRCPQHTDEQRKTVRHFLLGQEGSDLPDTPDDVHVDVDTFDEGDSHSLRESMNRSWDVGSSTNPSPVESISTSNGLSNAKRKDKKASASLSARSSNIKKSKSRSTQGSASSTSSNSNSGHAGSADLD